MRLPKAVPALTGALAFFALLEAATVLSPVNAAYIPDATTVLGRLLALLGDPAFLERIGKTLLTLLSGLALATAIAVPSGVVLGSSDLCYRLVRAPLELLRPIPAVALIPLFILMFGQTFQANMWMVVYACIWPILLNTIYGVHDVTRGARDTARAFGLGRIAVLVRVELPSALPLIVTGMRVAGAIALVVAVSAEMLVASTGGLGSYINDSSQSGNGMTATYAATAAAGLLGLLTNWALLRLGRRLCPWRADGAQEGI
ncbi:ABC transporter permease subunit [Streptomyces sp. NPDC048278]|uniref:ABC transporter permease n=1 Tax=Streptomyces sp. NPDC048278 TaxID=3155809 RepID=UPI00344542F9